MPDWKRLIRERIAPLRMEAAAEAALADELAQHLEDCYRELLSGGAGEDEAYQSAMAELDDIYPLRAGLDRIDLMPKHDAVSAGDTRPGNFLDDLWRDLRYALRTMWKNPLFVLFVVLTLALGIGANSTVFTIINTLILNPLPVPNSGELFSVSMARTNDSTKSGPPLPGAYADLKDYEAGNQVFRSFVAYSSPRVGTWQADGGAERMFIEFVTAGYFPTLGIQPAKGRFFLPQEDTAAGAQAVAVINFGTWQTRLGGAEDILGKTLRLNNMVVTIVGVAPPHFIGVSSLFGPDLWIPSAMAEKLLPNEMHAALSDRGKTAFLALGRLKPGVTQAQAQASVATIAARLARDHSETNQGRTAMVRPVSDALFASANSGTSSILAGSAALLIVVGIVLLIACSNVANLLLARAATRQQEIAVRLAMGASRRRLICQFLTESVLLGLMSGAVGLFIAYAALNLLWSALPSTANFIAPKFDITVFAFGLAISLATGFLFGTIPACKASRTGVAQALKEEARTAGRSQSKVTLANALLVGQVAFSFLLLAMAALFLRSIGRAYEMDPGFQTAHLALFMTNPGQIGYGKAQTKAFYQSALERVARVPGVESVSWASNLPLWSRTVNRLQLEGRQQRSQAESITAIVNTVDRDFFQTAGVVIVRGRTFAKTDQDTSAPVAILNEKMARDYWPAGDALGKRVQLPDEKITRQIVGIARNANYTSWGEPPQGCVYVPLDQKYSDAMVLYVRSAGDPKGILIPVQRELQAAGPKIVVNDMRTGREIVDGGLFQPRMGVILLSVFGLLALGLASIGLYGLMAYSVSQRKREIGLRMALGAGQGSVLRLILRQGMSLVLTGVLIGLMAALVAGRFLSRMLYGVSGSDPISVAAAAVLLLSVAMLACYLPARWASRVDPLVALREG